MTEGNHMELSGPVPGMGIRFLHDTIAITSVSQSNADCGNHAFSVGLAGIRKAREETECLEVHG